MPKGGIWPFLDMAITFLFLEIEKSLFMLFYAEKKVFIVKVLLFFGFYFLEKKPFLLTL